MPSKSFSCRHIGLMIDPLSGYGHNILKGIHRYSQLKSNWRIALFDRNRRDLADLIRTWQGDGIICTALGPSFSKAARSRTIPIVNIAGRITDPAFINVIAEDHVAGQCAAGYLLERGFESFGFVHNLNDLAYARKRCEGYRQTIAAAGYPCQSFALGKSNHDRLSKWLRRLPRPIAITGASDQHAAMIIEACWRHSIQVPGEITILGIGNHPQLCELCSPTLSSLDLDLENRGYNAARLIDRILAGKSQPKGSQLIPPADVIQRQSTDIYAFKDKHIVTALNFIRSNAAFSINVRDVVKATGISRRRLEDRFLQITKRTVHQEIWSAHFKIATRLLTHSDLRLEEVARLSGFRTASSLANLFQQRYNMTPRAYRIANRRY